MTTAELLTDLVSRGIEFQAHGDKLRFRPTDRLTPTDVVNIRRHKPALLALLRGEGFEYRHPAADPRPLTICDRCDSAEHIETSIHGGQSVRRDCGQCHRFMGWPRWYGRTLEDRHKL